MNKITYFLEWLTYNPDNIPVEEIVRQMLRPAFYLFIGWSMLYCLFITLFLSKFRAKAILFSMFIAFYTIMSLAWLACFYSDNLFVQFMPIYPLIVILIIRKFVKIVKQRQVQ